MTKKTYVVMHPKLAIKCQLEGDKKPKVQCPPVGTEIDLDIKDDAPMLVTGKLQLKGKVAKATAAADEELKAKAESADALAKEVEELKAKLAAAEKAGKELKTGDKK